VASTTTLTDLTHWTGIRAVMDAEMDANMDLNMDLDMVAVSPPVPTGDT
jgi:hypothetical protein